MSDLRHTHGEILALQEEMKEDEKLKDMCEKYGLPWDIVGGYEPRWYNGPVPKDVRVLFFMAEPGAITPSEAHNLLPAISHSDWIGNYDLGAQEHYWRDNLRHLCHHIWPEQTEESMYSSLGGSCAFWMSLPSGSQTSNVSKVLVDYFTHKYLKRFIAFFPNAVLLAAGKKAQTRLLPLKIPFEKRSALTKPESNKPRAIESWEQAGKHIASSLPAETLTMKDISMKKLSMPTKIAISDTSEQGKKISTLKKRQQGPASVAFGKVRSNEETLSEAHALAALYDDKETASVIHLAIAACAPGSGYRILLYPCTYSQHYSNSLKKRRWESNRAHGLPVQFHDIAKKAIKQKDSIASLHKVLTKDYKSQDKSQRLEVALRLRDKVRDGLD